MPLNLTRGLFLLPRFNDCDTINPTVQKGIRLGLGGLFFFSTYYSILLFLKVLPTILFILPIILFIAAIIPVKTMQKVNQNWSRGSHL